MTSFQLTILIVDILSVTVLGFGIVLHRRLSLDRHAFLSVLHIDRPITMPRTMGPLTWIYACMTVVLLVISVLPFLPSFSLSL